MTRPFYTFGVHSLRLDYALPCANLAWNGSAWIGGLTPEVAKGAGKAFMAVLLDDIVKLSEAGLIPAGTFTCVLSIDDFAAPQLVVWQILGVSGSAVMSATLRRAADSVAQADEGPRRSAKAAAAFALLTSAGMWMPQTGARKSDRRWLTVARSAHLHFAFEAWQPPEEGAGMPARFMFGVSGESSYAFFCADLAWQGRRSWGGRATKEAWRGAGRRVINRFWETLAQRLGDRASREEPLLCTIEVDDDDNPGSCSWRLVSPGGQVVVSIMFTRVDAPAESPPARQRSFVTFDRLTIAGPWSPVTIGNAPRRWLGFAASAKFLWNFRRLELLGGAPRLTFGARRSGGDYAFPCADLAWDGKAWTGSASQELVNGSGDAVMAAFWEELGRKAEEHLDIACLLTVYIPSNPRTVLWQMLGAGEEVIFGVSWVPSARPLAPPLPRKPTPQPASALFQRLADAGPWIPWAPIDQPGRRWFDLATETKLLLNFRRRRFWDKSGRRLSTFGVQSDPRHYALPCVDLAWDGGSWISAASRNVCSGGGGEDVMAAIWEDIESSGEASAEPLRCVLTADDMEDPTEVVWQLVNEAGGVVVTIPLSSRDATPGDLKV